MRAKAEYDKLLTAKDVGSATFKDTTWIEQRYAQTKVLVTEDVAAARSELEEFKTRKRALEEAVEVLPEIWFFRFGRGRVMTLCMSRRGRRPSSSGATARYLLLDLWLAVTGCG